MQELLQVSAALYAIITQRNGSFAIVSVKERRRCFVQFAATEPTGLYAEAVGNRGLATRHALSQAQQTQMRERGWHGDGTEPWSITYREALTPDETNRIASDALETLRTVYGARGEIRVEVQLEGPGASAAGEPLWAQGIEPVTNPVSSPWVKGVTVALVVLIVTWLVMGWL